MVRFQYIILGTLCLGAAFAEDTEITRVQTLKNEDRNQKSGSLDDAQNVYSINILPLPRPNQADGVQGQDSNDLNKGVGGTPPGKVPALFFLQKVQDEGRLPDGRLPDGIYYVPAKDEPEPKPVIQTVSILYNFTNEYNCFDYKLSFK